MRFAPNGKCAGAKTAGLVWFGGDDWRMVAVFATTDGTEYALDRDTLRLREVVRIEGGRAVRDAR